MICQFPLGHSAWNKYLQTVIGEKYYIQSEYGNSS